MPIIKVSIAEGKSEEELRSLISALHQTAERYTGASPDGTTVLIEQVPAKHWSRADVTVAERRAGSKG